MCMCVCVCGGGDIEDLQWHANHFFKLHCGSESFVNQD